MLAEAHPVSFVLTSDIAAVRPFYSDVLGLPERGEDEYGVSYALGSGTLRLTKVPDHAPSGHTVIGWEVDDFAAVVKDLAAKGVSFMIYDGFGQDERGVWTDPSTGKKMVWFNDSVGNNLMVMSRDG